MSYIVKINLDLQTAIIVMWQYHTVLALTNEKHEKVRQFRQTNTSQPLLFFERGTHTDRQLSCQLFYGATENVHNKELCTSGKITEKKPLVILLDRKCNTEA